MNSTNAATLLATRLDAATGLDTVDVLPAGSEDEANIPCAIVSFEDFEEHEFMFGHHEGDVVVTLSTIPADTTAAAHSALVDVIVAFLCDEAWMADSLADDYSVIEAFNAQAPLTEEDGHRVSEISVRLKLAEFAGA